MINCENKPKINESDTDTLLTMDVIPFKIISSGKLIENYLFPIRTVSHEYA